MQCALLFLRSKSRKCGNLAEIVDWFFVCFFFVADVFGEESAAAAAPICDEVGTPGECTVIGGRGQHELGTRMVSEIAHRDYSAR